jgi:hypothetical protein
MDADAKTIYHRGRRGTQRTGLQKLPVLPKVMIGKAKATAKAYSRRFALMDADQNR